MGVLKMSKFIDKLHGSLITLGYNFWWILLSAVLMGAGSGLTGAGITAAVTDTQVGDIVLNQTIDEDYANLSAYHNKLLYNNKKSTSEFLKEAAELNNNATLTFEASKPLVPYPVDPEVYQENESSLYIKGQERPRVEYYEVYNTSLPDDVKILVGDLPKESNEILVPYDVYEFISTKGYDQDGTILNPGFQPEDLVGKDLYIPDAYDYSVDGLGTCSLSFIKQNAIKVKITGILTSDFDGTDFGGFVAPAFIEENGQRFKRYTDSSIKGVYGITYNHQSIYSDGLGYGGSGNDSTDDYYRFSYTGAYVLNKDEPKVDFYSFKKPEIPGDVVIPFYLSASELQMNSHSKFHLIFDNENSTYFDSLIPGNFTPNGNPVRLNDDLADIFRSEIPALASRWTVDECYDPEFDYSSWPHYDLVKDDYFEYKGEAEPAALTDEDKEGIVTTYLSECFSWTLDSKADKDKMMQTMQAKFNENTTNLLKACINVWRNKNYDNNLYNLVIPNTNIELCFSGFVPSKNQYGVNIYLENEVDLALLTGNRSPIEGFAIHNSDFNGFKGNFQKLYKDGFYLFDESLTEDIDTTETVIVIIAPLAIVLGLIAVASGVYTAHLWLKRQNKVDNDTTENIVVYSTFAVLTLGIAVGTYFGFLALFNAIVRWVLVYSPIQSWWPSGFEPIGIVLGIIVAIISLGLSVFITKNKKKKQVK